MIIKLFDRFNKNQSNTVPASNTYEIISSIWLKHGAIDELVQLLNFFEKSNWCWKNENPNIWLIYICALLEKGKIAHAKKF